MAKADTKTPQSGQEPGSPGGERIPVMQSLLDNPFLLLFIGVTIPAVLYIIWGIMDIIQIPIAK
jgi:hypothetical protein